MSWQVRTTVFFHTLRIWRAVIRGGCERRQPSAVFAGETPDFWFVATTTPSHAELKWIPSCRWVAPWSSSPVACQEKTPKLREGTWGLSAGAASAAGRASAGGEVSPAAARKCPTRGSESTRTTWRKNGRPAKLSKAVLRADRRAVYHLYTDGVA